MTPEIIKNMETERIADIFIMTGSIKRKNIQIVRGWLMGEMERRNPEGFDKWLDSDCYDEDIKKYIM